MQHDEASGDWDMKTYEQTANSLGTLHGLDLVRLSPGERRMAKAYLALAELLADMLVRTCAGLGRGFGLVGRGIAAFAQRSKVPVIAAEPN
jgi:glycosyltransferase involved in cell wall biosynthesis